jgi:hypothetical protein
MRIALSPNLRIAAGLLLAALLSIVGYQVFRRWISHGPEALLKRADDLSWLEDRGSFADSAYRAQAMTPLSKPALIGSVLKNGPNTCASIKLSNCLPSGNLNPTVDRLLASRSPFAYFCTEHSPSQLRMTY